MEPPRNRKQRRAAAASAGTASEVDSSFDPASISLSRPSMDDGSSRRPNGKTLYDLIAERQISLLGEQGAHTENQHPDSAPVETQFVTVDPATGKISPFGSSMSPETDGKPSIESTNDASQIGRPSDPDEPLPPLIDTLLLAFPLSVLHMTLAYLAAHQYAQDIDLGKLFRESALVAFPVLTMLIHISHGHVVKLGSKAHRNDTTRSVSLLPLSRDKFTASFLIKMIFPPSWKTLLFLPLAAFLGTRLVIITNESPYYAVMKRAPAVGTLWIWSVLELSLGGAVLGSLGPLLWGVFWKGYVLF